MSTLNSMLNDYGRAPLLTAAQEIHLGGLVRRWQDHEDGPDAAPPAVRRAGLRARDRMVLCNARLCVSVAKKYCRLNYSDDRLMDHIQNGMVGLARGAEKFQPALGYKFSTYAYWWIRQGITRGGENDSIIRLPGMALQEYRTLERAIAQLQQEGRKPTPELLSEMTGLTEEHISFRLEIGKVRVVASLDAQAGSPDGSSLLDLIASEPDTTTEDEDELADMRSQVQRNMGCLTESQTRVFNLALQGLNQREIAGTIGCSRAGAGTHLSAAKSRLRESLAIAS
jgi:RNA polymerase sigma factor (sigma-70 family)